MRILHVIENLNTGGAEHMLVNLAIEQTHRHHEVEVLCLFELGELAGKLMTIGVNVYAAQKYSGSNGAFIRRIAGVVSKFAPDVIHTHSLMGNYYLAFVRLFTAPRAVQVVTRHGLLRGGHIKRLGMLFHLSLWMTHWAVGVCDAVSAELFTQHAHFKDRIVSIKNGIDLGRFKLRNAKSQADLKAQLKLTPQHQLVGIVARLDPIKNHTLLLTAFAEVNKALPNTVLVIIGDGVMREALETHARTLKLDSVVFFLGDRIDVPELLAGLDAYVLSSDNEGYSLSLLEASAAGLPLVATAVGGNADIVRQGQNGLIVPPKSPAALAEALIHLLNDAPQAMLMGNDSRAWVERHGSVQAMADAYEQLYAMKARTA